jgi:GTPase SAR1 family protein
MSAIKTLIGKHDQKLSIAIVGLGNSGKTSFVKRILQKDELIQATVGNTANFELHLFGNLTLITWDLDDKIPENDTMWKRSILGADVLFYIVDSTDSGNFNLNRDLIEELVDKINPQYLLILGSKADLTTSVSVGELINDLNLIEIDRMKCKCDLFKYSSSTGEGLYAIEEWLSRVVFKRKEQMVDYVSIAACLVHNQETNEFLDVIITPDPKINLLSALRELKRKVQIFARTMKMHDTGEDLLEISNYKIVIVKDQKLSIAIVVQKNDSIQRAISIGRNILKIISPYYHQPADLRKIVRDLYPLDL